MKEKMKAFILERYPAAQLVRYISTVWSTEYLFYPDHDTRDTYTCILTHGQLTIRTGF